MGIFWVVVMGGRADAGRLLGGAFSMSDVGDGLARAGGRGVCCLVAVDRVADAGAFAFTGVGECWGGALRGLSRWISLRTFGLFEIDGYAILAFGLGVGLGGACCDASVDATSTAVSARGFSVSSSASSTVSGSSATFLLAALVVFARFDFVVFAVPFRFPFVVAVEAVDMTDIVLASMDSSKSGMSIMLAASESNVVLLLD